MAFYTMAFLGTAPLGSLLAGVLADRIGESMTIVVGGVACVLGSVWFTSRLPRLRELVRPIYLQQGIIGARHERELALLNKHADSLNAAAVETLEFQSDLDDDE